jgi:transposase
VLQAVRRLLTRPECFRLEREFAGPDFTGESSAPSQGTHNNVLERDIRPFVTGRKSWLFSDTVAGAKASAVIYSPVLTCRACGVEPYTWLRHVLTQLPLRPPDDDIEDLMPFNFAERAPHQNTC